VSAAPGRIYVLRPLAGASAPAAVAGLSKGHNCTQPSVTFHTGGSLVEIKKTHGQSQRPPGQEPPLRADITEFSRKSRQRLRLDLAKVDQKECGQPLFFTLTYPEEFPLDGETFKRHRRAIGERLRRAFPHAGWHWKLEFQERGAPHFHLIGWRLSADREYVKALRGWVASNWFEIVGSDDLKHFHAGTSVEVIRSQFAIMRYIGPYVSKNDQSAPGKKVGRYWGKIAAANIPYAQVERRTLTTPESLLVWRTARRYMISQNRQRRIIAVEKHLPGARDDLLSGRLRGLRKRSPQLTMWKTLPRKWRPNNNCTINLFCSATFWRNGIERLLAV
jgi:hypothetical protein